MPKALLAEEPLKLAADARGKYLWIVGTKVAEALNDSGILTEVIVTDGEAANLDLLLNSKVDIALVSATTLNSYLKEKGTGDRFSTITALWPRVMHFILLEKFIKTESLADFDRRRVYKGSEGSLEREIVEGLFRSMGIRSKRLVTEVDELNVIDIMTDYIVQKLDGAVFVDYVPSPTLTSILGKTGHFYKLIPAGKDAAYLTSRLGEGYFVIDLPEDIYPYQGDAYRTIGVGSYLISRKELPQETALKIVEVIFTNAEDIEGDLNFGLKLKKESGAENLVVPLHPGAEPYFKAVP